MQQYLCTWKRIQAVRLNVLSATMCFCGNRLVIIIGLVLEYRFLLREAVFSIYGLKGAVLKNLRCHLKIPTNDSL